MPAASRLIRVVTLGGCVAMALAGCGTQDSSTATDPKAGPTTAAATSSPVEAYTVLAGDFTGFVKKIDAARVDEEPTTVEGWLAVADYDFHDGVTLAEFDDEQYRLCFTGPQDTYLSFSVNDNNDVVTRTLGVGVCDYADGEIVTRVTEVESASQEHIDSVRSDAKMVALTLEAFAGEHTTDGGGDPTALNVEEAMSNFGYTLDAGNTVTDYEATEDWNYKFCVLHADSGAYATYDSTLGGIQGMGTDGVCSFAATDVVSPTDDAPQWVETIVKGQNVAEQVPTLSGFTDLLKS